MGGAIVKPSVELRSSNTGASGLVESASERRWRLLFFTLVMVAVVVMLAWPFFDHALNNDHYVYLARSMVRGELNVDNMPPEYRDFVAWEGHKYLPFGPLPAVLLVPFLPLLDSGLYLAWVSYLFTLINVLVFNKVLVLAGVRDERRKWALLLFFAGTSYFGVNLGGISTYFAHVVAVTFLLLAMWEMLGKRRLLLVGLLLGLAGMTRLTVVFTLPFFLWLTWQTIGEKQVISASEQSPVTQDRPPTARSPVLPRMLSIIYLGVGLGIPVVLLGLYNYMRFGNPLESGYALAQLYERVLEEARRVGLFSLAHVPKNLFMMLLQGPVPVSGENAPVFQFPYIQPSAWGMSIFLTTPALVYVFRAPLANRLVQACWLGVLGAMVPIITYYGVGWVQFGYRYALDFMPFLIVLVALGWGAPMSRLARLLVLVSVAVCIWGGVYLASWL